jgi:hypothetical protein
MPRTTRRTAQLIPILGVAMPPVDPPDVLARPLRTSSVGFRPGIRMLEPIPDWPPASPLNSAHRTAILQKVAARGAGRRPDASSTSSRGMAMRTVARERRPTKDRRAPRIRLGCRRTAAGCRLRLSTGRPSAASWPARSSR